MFRVKFAVCFLFSSMLYDVLYGLVFTILILVMITGTLHFWRYSLKSSLPILSCMIWLSTLCVFSFMNPAVTNFLMLVVKLSLFFVIFLYHFPPLKLIKYLYLSTHPLIWFHYPLESSLYRPSNMLYLHHFWSLRLTNFHSQCWGFAITWLYKYLAILLFLILSNVSCFFNCFFSLFLNFCYLFFRSFFHNLFLSSFSYLLFFSFFKSFPILCFTSLFLTLFFYSPNFSFLPIISWTRFP